MQGQCQGTECQPQFLLQDDVSCGLSARRLDPRRRRAETGFAAGPNWDGAKKRASARFSQVAFCVSPGPFFLKRIGKLRVVTSHGTTFGADGCPFKHLRLALGEFSEPRHTLKYSNVLLTSCSPFSRCPRPRVLNSRESISVALSTTRCSPVSWRTTSSL